MKSIFVYAQHRSGSTLLNNILNSATNVQMLPDEVNLYAPFKNTTFEKAFWKSSLQIKDLEGSFWRYASDYKITDALIADWRNDCQSQEEFVKRFIFHLLEATPSDTVFGAKYFCHLRRKKLLDSLVPGNVVNVLLTRDIYAVLNSKLNDNSMRKRKEILGFLFILLRWATIVYFCWEFRLFAAAYEDESHDFVCLKYEDFKKDKNYVKRLFSPLGFCFPTSIDRVDGKASSTKNKESKDIRYLTATERTFVNILTRKARKILKYA